MKGQSTQNIDGKQYIFTQMGPKDAVRIVVRLAKVMGKPTGGAIGSLDLEGTKKRGGSEVDMKSLGDALGSLFDKVEEEETIDTIEKLLGTVMFEGQSLHMEHPHFQGKTLHLFKVSKKALQENFSDFLAGSSGVIGALKAKFNTILASQTSVGTSGDQSSAA